MGLHRGMGDFVIARLNGVDQDIVLAKTRMIARRLL